VAATVIRQQREALTRAHDRATRTPIVEVAAELQQILGQRTTAVIARVQDAKLVGKWARGEHAPRQEAERRLRAAFQVALLLLEFDSAPTVRSWFLGMNPYLDDRSPSLVIAEGTPGDWASVLQAARGFIADG
jgi:hypothetical protein